MHPMFALSLSRLMRLLRSFRREEVILQGAFLVGLISLALLFAQPTRREVKKEEPSEQRSKGAVQPVMPTAIGML